MCMSCPMARSSSGVAARRERAWIRATAYPGFGIPKPGYAVARIQARSLLAATPEEDLAIGQDMHMDGDVGPLELWCPFAHCLSHIRLAKSRCRSHGEKRRQ